MKKIYALIFFVLGLASILHAQVSNYGFTQTAGSFTPISGGILLGNTGSDDEYFVDPANPAGGFTATGPGFPIGFNFIYDNQSFDRVGIRNDGWIGLGQSAVNPSVNLSSTSAYTPLSSAVAIAPPQLRSRIVAMGRDLAAQAGSSLRIETIGSAPNRTLVIQWINYSKWNNTGDDFNFQIRLNETSNTI